MLAIDFQGKKRIFIINKTTREIIRDIFYKKRLMQAFKNIFIVTQILNK